MRETDSQSERLDAARNYSARRQWLSLAFLILTTSALIFGAMLGARAAAEKAASASSSNAVFGSEPEAFTIEPQDYSRFSHTSPGAHAGFADPSACANCHQRNSTAAQPTFPGHKACIDCHLAQFTTVNIPLCTICHVNDLGNPNPGLKGFPGLRSFRVAFDHQQHQAARAACASCHQTARRGVAFSIPAGLNAHTQCYTCHSPGLSASNLSSCGTCHASVGRHTRTPATARAFSYSFSHATHGARQRLGCTDCHIVRAGLPQSRQVSAPAAFQHFPRSRAQSCATCHNNQRAFGEADFGDCKKCHKGATFRMGGF